MLKNQKKKKNMETILILMDLKMIVKDIKESH